MQVCRSQEAAQQQVLNPPRALSLDVHRQRRLLKTADNVTWVERRAYYRVVSAASPPSSAPSPLLPRWLVQRTRTTRRAGLAPPTTARTRGSQVLLGARFVITRKRGYFAPLEMGDDSTNAKAPLLTASPGEVTPSQGAGARPSRDFTLLLSHCRPAGQAASTSSSCAT